ncbi:Flp pilus assembly complex ATPase component TadA [bacterium]|nr:Flp pilus assembly complex ATPase component TadA [candidate division CSSED10-310 bacterium]
MNSEDIKNTSSGSPNKDEQDQTLEFKLGEVLREAGLIKPKLLDEMLEKQKSSGENFVDLLKREVSLDSLKALMLTEIPIPFLKSRKKEELENVLLESGIITDKELSKALKDEETPEDQLGQLLVERNIISADDLKKALNEKSKTGLPLWRVLLSLRMVNHATISELMKARIGSGTTKAREEFLIDVLLNMNLLTKEQLARARQVQEEKGGSIFTRLVELKELSQDDLAKTLEDILDIPFVDLSKKPPDPNMLFVIPEHIIRSKRILPLRVKDGQLLLGMLEPLDEESIHRAQLITGLPIQPCLIKRSDWENAIHLIPTAKADHGTGSELERILKEGTQAGAISSEDMSAVQMASAIIDGAINARATDIHLEPQLPELRVRYRIDGVLYDVMTIPNRLELPVISRLKLLSNMDITEKRRPQDGHFSMKLQDREFNFRTATIPTYLGEKMTIRFLDEARVLKGMSQLGLEPEEIDILAGLVEKPHGLLIVTGPIGSGKTTTLYASLNQTNILNRNVITIEDPVEYRLTGINQIQVNSDIGLDFRTGLRSILRHDADIIMVGEVRDGETARVATWAALTGQLVFCTLHTNNAAASVTMLRNLGVENFLVSSSLTAVIAQRLVRQLCPECKEMVSPEPIFREKFELGNDPDIKIGKAVGCNSCFHTGYQGRTGIFEILVIDKEIRQMIVNGAADADIENHAKRKGMKTLWQNGIEKLRKGITTPEEVLREIVLN